MKFKFEKLTPVLVALSFVAIAGCTKKATLDKTNTLYLSTPQKIKGLDPAFASDLYSGNEVGRVYEGLLQYSYLKRPYQLEPALAESMPTVSKDGKTYTFKLKQGVVFQDDAAFKATNGKGREFEAEDVVYSFKRLADPKLNSTGWWIFEGKIVGLDDWRKAGTEKGADYNAPVEGLKAVDKHTLAITLKAPSSQFPFFLAMTFASIVPREAVEHYGQEFQNHGVGTGPFKVSEFNPTAKMVYVKNPTYRKEFYPSEGEAGDKEKGLLDDAGKQIPFVDKVVVQVFEESQPQWLTFMQGKLDASSIPKDNFASAMPSGKELSPELKAKNLTLHVSPSLDITHTSFNMADPVVGKNKLLRQAISLAQDTDKYIELFYNGRAISAQGPIPPGLSGYEESMKNPYKMYNVEKAKELLKKAGYPEGKGLAPLEYLSLPDSTSRQGTEFMQKELAAIGITIKVSTYSWPQFLEQLKNKRGQMWSYAWGADYPDAENFLQLFYSKNASPGPNDSNYSNPEFDKLYDQSLKMTEGPARTALYKKMAAMVIEDTPWIFGSHRLSYGLTHPWLKNYKNHDLDHTRAKYYRVDTNLKK